MSDRSYTRASLLRGVIGLRRRSRRRLCDGMEILEPRRLLTSTVADHFFVTANSSDYDEGGVLTQHAFEPIESTSGGRSIVDLSSFGAAARLTPNDASVDSSDPLSESGYVARQLVQVSPGSIYQLQAAAYHVPDTSTLSLSFKAFDHDQFPITAVHVSKFVGAVDTTVFATINDGDTSILISDATGWSNAGPAVSRGLAWFGYASADGTRYPDYTYTRNVIGDASQGAWAVDAIQFDAVAGAYRIELAQPWTGGSVSAGTAIRNAVTDHESFPLETTRSTQNVRHDFSPSYARRYATEAIEVSATIAGTDWDPQADSQSAVPPGTQSIQIEATNPLLNASIRMLHDGDLGTASLDAAVASFDAKPLFAATQSVQSFASDQIFPVDTNKAYTLGVYADVYATTDQPTSVETHSLGYRALDEDGLEILPQHVQRFVGSADTTLAQPLQPGDTQIVLVDATGWSNTNNDPATRSLAWYGYTSGRGTTYADFTYTRHTAVNLIDGLWAQDSRSGNTITLNQPWSGPPLPAGSAVRNAVAGDALQPVIASGSTLPIAGNRLTSPLLSGNWVAGIPSASAFPPGTDSLRLAGRINESNLTQDDIVSITAFTIQLGTETVVAPNPSSHRHTFQWDVAANDPAVIDSDFVIDRVSDATFGTVALQSDGTVSYVSDSYFVGTDQFTYTLRDPIDGDEITESVSITILGTNASSDTELVQALANNPSHVAIASDPAAHDDGRLVPYRVVSGQSLQVDGATLPHLLSNDGVYGTGSDRAVSSFLVAPTVHGSLNLAADGTFVYRSNPGFTGTDHFTYAIFDGLRVETAVASIQVFATQTELVEANLELLAQGMFDYSDVYNRFAVSKSSGSSYFDDNGAPFLSWRVHLLPFLGYHDLYSQFHLDEPWDSDHNLALLPNMPIVFGDGSGTGHQTRIQTITGPRIVPSDDFGNVAFIDNEDGPRLSQIVDGANNTILLMQAGPDRAIPWTQPLDAAFDYSNPITTAGQISAKGLSVVMFDGSVYRLPATMESAEFAALATSRGKASEALSDPGTIVRQAAFDAGGTAEIERLDRQGAAQDDALQALGLALHQHHDVFGKLGLPATGSTQDANGNTYLSWRVHVLPFLGYQQLYDRFALDEPWDSPNNLPLLSQMPDIFRSYGDPATSTTTRFQTLWGPGAVFDRNADGSDLVPRLSDLTDGSQNTLLVIEAGVDRGVRWTQPDEFRFDPDDATAWLGTLPTGDFRAILADRTSTKLPADLSPETFLALATRSGEEVIDPQTLARLYADINPREISRDQLARMKSIALGIHDFEDTYRRLTIADVASYFDSQDNPLLSWRVHVLPFLGHANLYSQFRLDEAWDSDHNLPLASLMPDVFRSVGDAWDSTTTRIQTFVDGGTEAADFKDGALFQSSGPGPRFRDIRDGTANTILFVESGPDAGVIWTQPDDISFDRNDPYGPMGDLDDFVSVAFADASINVIRSDLPDETINRLIQSQDGLPVDINNPSVRESSIQHTILREGRQSSMTVLRSSGSVGVTVDDPTLLSVFPTTLSFDGDLSGLTQSITFQAADNDTIEGPRSTMLHVGDQSFEIHIVDNDRFVRLNDYGDAPSSAQSGFASSYPVRHADHGALHLVGPLFLGSGVDADIDGVPSVDARSDRTVNAIDDDGIRFTANIVAVGGTPTASSAAVTASAAGRLDAWMDFNRDGDWDDVGEQILSSHDVDSGTQLITFTVPGTAVAGETYARFRLSSAGGLAATGDSPDGEVEDYRITVLDGNTAGNVDAQIVATTAGAIDVFATADDIVVQIGATEMFRVPRASLNSFTMEGSDGDDTFNLADVDAVFSGLLAIEAGDGNDRINLIGEGNDFDLTLLANDALRSVEILDIRGSGNNRLSLTPASVGPIAGAGNALTIFMDARDELNTNGAAFAITGTEIVDDTLQYVVTDGEIALKIRGTQWTNPLDRFDTNNSGHVTALDALVILNQLRRGDATVDGTAKLVDPTTLATLPDKFYDVSGEGSLSPIDALQILNFLNRNRASGEAFLAVPVVYWDPWDEEEPTPSEPETLSPDETFPR